jgi:putative oxidoreductase
MANIVSTKNDATLGVMRLVLGIVFFAHGAQKMLGWFGGYGFTGTMGYFTGVVHLPYILGVLAICAEFFGGISLILGVLARVGAAAVMTNMVCAILLVHLPAGLFMNFGQAVIPNSNPPTAALEGYEFHLIAIAACLYILINGAGAFSVDGAIAPAGTRRTAQTV